MIPFLTLAIMFNAVQEEEEFLRQDYHLQIEFSCYRILGVRLLTRYWQMMEDFAIVILHCCWFQQKDFDRKHLNKKKLIRA